MEGSMTVALLDDASPSIWDARRKRGLRPVMRSAPRRWRRRILGALVIGYLLFCHGCHGDEDNELFTKSLKQKWGQAPRPAESVPIFEARGSAPASSRGSIISDVGLQWETVAAATGRFVPVADSSPAPPARSGYADPPAPQNRRWTPNSPPACAIRRLRSRLFH